LPHEPFLAARHRRHSRPSHFQTAAGKPLIID
jgi:hypothetical protein